MSTDSIPPEAVDSNTAAGMLGISEATLRTWRSRGINGPPYIKLGETGKVVYLVEELRAWRDARRIVPAHMQVAAQKKTTSSTSR